MNTQVITNALVGNNPANQTATPAQHWSRRFLSLDLVKPNPATFARFIGLALVIYLLGVPQMEPFLALPLICLFIYGVVIDQRLLHNGYFWMVTTALCLINVYFNFYSVANHHFLLVYFGFALALTFLQPRQVQTNFLTENVRWIMVIMFFFVTFQKAFSPTYMDGGFFAYLTAKGGLFSILQDMVPGLGTLIESNKEALRAFAGVNPHQQMALPLIVEEPFLFKLYSLAVSYGVVTFEFLTMLGFLIFSKGKIRHIFLLMTIVGVAVSRGEGGYLSLLCAAGFILTTPDAKIFRPMYIASFLIISGLIFIGWMFH